MSREWFPGLWAVIAVLAFAAITLRYAMPTHYRTESMSETQLWLGMLLIAASMLAALFSFDFIWR
jgi:hypothetical protein